MILFFLLGTFTEYKYNSIDRKSETESFPKNLRNQISNVRKSGVQISRCEVFILAGLLTNTYILIPITSNFFGKILKQTFRFLLTNNLTI